MRPFGKGLSPCSSSSAPSRSPSRAAPPRSPSDFPVTLKLADGTFTFKICSARDRVALAHRDRDALRHRRGSSGESRRQLLRLPAERPEDLTQRLRPERRGDREVQPRPRRRREDTAGFNTQMAALKIPVLYDPAAANLSQAYAQYGDLGDATGHVNAGQEGSRLDQGEDRPHRCDDAAREEGHDLLLRTRTRLLLGHLLDVRRQAVLAARPQVDRRQREGRRRRAAATRS